MNVDGTPNVVGIGPFGPIYSKSPVVLENNYFSLLPLDINKDLIRIYIFFFFVSRDYSLDRIREKRKRTPSLVRI